MSDLKPTPKRFANIHQFQINHVEGLETVCRDSVDIFDKWKNEFVSLSLAVALAQMFMKGESPFEQLAKMEVVHGMVDMETIHVLKAVSSYYIIQLFIKRIQYGLPR